MRIRILMLLVLLCDFLVMLSGDEAVCIAKRAHAGVEDRLERLGQRQQLGRLHAGAPASLGRARSEPVALDGGW